MPQHPASPSSSPAPGARASRPLTTSVNDNVPNAPSPRPCDLRERDARAPRLRRGLALLLALIFLLTASWPPPPPALGPQSRGVRPADPAPTPTNTPAYVWLPVQVPSNAVALVFDFTLSGDGASDRVVAGINASKLFSLATQFIATNTAMSSGPLPVERWAGQDVELFLGVAGGTSTNALLSVSGIRFLSLPLPLLVARNSGPNAVVSWTEASPGFVLEYATNLTAAAGSWSAITNVGGYVGQRVFTNQTSPSGGFYRLRRP